MITQTLQILQSPFKYIYGSVSTGLNAEVQLLLRGMRNRVATEIHLRVAGYDRFQRISQRVALVGEHKSTRSFAVFLITSQLGKVFKN